MTSEACRECSMEIDDPRTCGPCQAFEIFREFMKAMPEIEFRIRPNHPDINRLVRECYEGDAQRYFMESWENFLDQS